MPPSWCAGSAYTYTEHPSSPGIRPRHACHAGLGYAFMALFPLLQTLFLAGSMPAQLAKRARPPCSTAAALIIGLWWWKCCRKAPQPAEDEIFPASSELRLASVGCHLCPARAACTAWGAQSSLRLPGSTAPAPYRNEARRCCARHPSSWQHKHSKHLVLRCTPQNAKCRNSDQGGGGHGLCV